MRVICMILTFRNNVVQLFCKKSVGPKGSSYVMSSDPRKQDGILQRISWTNNSPSRTIGYSGWFAAYCLSSAHNLLTLPFASAYSMSSSDPIVRTMGTIGDTIFVRTSILYARHILTGIEMVIVWSGMVATGSATGPRVVMIQPDQDLKALLDL